MILLVKRRPLTMILTWVHVSAVYQGASQPGRYGTILQDVQEIESAGRDKEGSHPCEAVRLCICFSSVVFGWSTLPPPSNRQGHQLRRWIAAPLKSRRDWHRPSRCESTVGLWGLPKSSVKSQSLASERRVAVTRTRSPRKRRCFSCLIASARPDSCSSRRSICFVSTGQPTTRS